MAITKHKSIKAKNGNESVKSKRQTKTSRAGLQFPVGRILRKMHGENLAKRVGPKSAVYIAAVLEFLVAEIIEIAGIVARQYKRVRITPRHLMLAIKTDHEFGPHVTFSQAGVIPANHKVLQRESVSAVVESQT